MNQLKNAIALLRGQSTRQTAENYDGYADYVGEARRWAAGAPDLCEFPPNGPWRPRYAWALGRKEAALGRLATEAYRK